MSNLTRQATYHCTNVECGHTFMALTEIVYTISPSATPDPRVHLPMSKHVQRALLREQLDRAPEADYQARNTGTYTPDLFGQKT
jgi:hypothetical protein